MRVLALVSFIWCALQVAMANPALMARRKQAHNPVPLPADADDDEWRFQPATDYDTNGCYSTMAIDIDGKTLAGLSALQDPAELCHSPNRLERNNVYSRKRCNNGWCAIMYDYYFEKDSTGSLKGGHRHDWENVIVFIKDGKLDHAAAACHGRYEHIPEDIYATDNHTHIVYSVNNEGTHCWRMAKPDDFHAENFTGKWIVGRLVGWNHWPNGTNGVDLKRRLHDAWLGDISPNIFDENFADSLRAACRTRCPGFDPDLDE